MYPSKANFTPLFAVRGDGCSDGVNTNTGITRITGITRNIVNYRLQHIQRESFPRSNNDATVHQVLQYYFRFTARFDVNFEKPESRKYTGGITCKVN